MLKTRQSWHFLKINKNSGSILSLLLKNTINSLGSTEKALATSSGYLICIHEQNPTFLLG